MISMRRSAPVLAALAFASATSGCRLFHMHEKDELADLGELVLDEAEVARHSEALERAVREDASIAEDSELLGSEDAEEEVRHKRLDFQAIERRKARLPQIEELLAKRIVAEDAFGMLTLVPPYDEALPQIEELELVEFQPEEVDVEKLHLEEFPPEDQHPVLNKMRIENADRRILYGSIVARGDRYSKEWQPVGEIYAGAIRPYLESGTRFQAPEREPLFGRFKESELGAKLSEAEPGRWFDVP